MIFTVKCVELEPNQGDKLETGEQIPNVVSHRVSITGSDICLMVRCLQLVMVCSILSKELQQRNWGRGGVGGRGSKQKEKMRQCKVVLHGVIVLSYVYVLHCTPYMCKFLINNGHPKLKKKRLEKGERGSIYL